ncbi:uncharacterized protein LOC142570343 [Dermacentor variabilis]|uniref:uncharacterized protein LOC142570343 n=1 Tax=Dermacentor variabilis TaxID=34621 RepID=UPI003F5C784F
MLVFAVTFCLSLASSFTAVQSTYGHDGGSMHESPAEVPVEAIDPYTGSPRWPTKSEDATRDDSAASRAAYEDIGSNPGFPEYDLTPSSEQLYSNQADIFELTRVAMKLKQELEDMHNRARQL